MTRPESTSDPLDDLLIEARGAKPALEPDFLARLEAEALAEMPVAGVGEPPRLGIFDLIGGWLGAGSLVAATLAGVWIGAAPPQSVTSLVDAALYGGGTVSVDLFGDLPTDLVVEGE